MKAIYLYLLFLLMPLAALAQDKQASKPASCKCDSSYTFVEKMPEFPGGEVALNKLLGGDVQRIYGRWLYTLKDTAILYTRVVLELTVCKDGYVGLVHISQPKELPGSYRRQIAACIQRVPWRPGRQGGNPVCVKLLIPLRYELQD
ncbi:hypothetical protein DCC81_22270 [Chitinophaga parva]|uniref:TonB C-terminal domain-containing protein n=1 Tax=Chitinophaga parva TaxID=2169414 RepID=A0A2T7BDM8_9BACT|nr:hypothetical protein [Chitinophaga parva]PUZ23130.1 hypothetical protein DCC81_22270 [Chitinophaga parva]